MLSKETVLDRIEVLEDGAIQVRRATYVVEDGRRIAGPLYHRAAYEPGAAIDQEHATVRAVAAVVWTPAVVAAAEARQRDRTT